jgi:3-oxoacyl-[acyl-carrier-protein] synthase-3
MFNHTKILSCGSYLPDKILTNDDLAKTVDTNDAWITERTGIKQRHIAADNEYCSDLGYKAAQAALAKANLSSDNIDGIIVATTTADNIFPATATKIQHKLNIKNAFAFDVQAVCSGFVYGLTLADLYIKSGKANNILIIGAETLSRILDWQDRNSCILFGDGAGAVILSKNTTTESNIIDSEIHSDGSLYEILNTNGGPSLTKGAGVITMQGKEVFKNAVTKMSSSVKSLLAKNQLDISEINLLIPHQANQRILSAVGKKLNLPEDKVISTVNLHANTSAASIPLALSVALDNNRVARGDYVVFVALGAGLTWGSILLKW